MSRARDTTDNDVRGFAIQARGRMEERARPAVPSLIELLRDEGAREFASAALSTIGAAAAPATAARLRETKDPAVRRSAAEALAGMDAKALEPVVASLEASLSGHRELGTYVAIAYLKIAPTPDGRQRGLRALVDGLHGGPTTASSETQRKRSRNSLRNGVPLP